MGAGKGKNRRLKSTSSTKTRVEEIPKPKFNFGDKVKWINVKWANDPYPEQITQITYDAENNTYYYGDYLDEQYEDEATLVESSTPSKQEERLKGYLHKTVVFKYCPK